MSPISVFSWIVFVVILVSAAYVFVALGQLPGKTARARNHPQADAIETASWLGLLLTLGVVWVVAMVWARSTPISGRFGTEDPDLDELKARVAALESAAQRQEAAGG